MRLYDAEGRADYPKVPATAAFHGWIEPLAARCRARSSGRLALRRGLPTWTVIAGRQPQNADRSSYSWRVPPYHSMQARVLVSSTLADGGSRPSKETKLEERLEADLFQPCSGTQRW